MQLGTKTGRRALMLFSGNMMERWGDYMDAQLDLNRYLLPAYAKEKNQQVIAMMSLTEAILLEFHRLCQENGCKLVFLIVDSRFQLRPQEWEQTLRGYGFDPELYDPEAVDKWLTALASREVIPVINCAEHFRKLKALRPTKFHWDIDGHWNSNGHREAAALTADFLETCGFLPVASLTGQSN